MSIEIVETVAGLRHEIAARRARGERIGFVATMGALHAGHARLIERAAAENDCAVVSVFVNPIQFNDATDFERYPRTLDADAALAAAAGAQIVFAPSNAEMYPRAPLTHVDVDELSAGLCGAFRPGHFRGVATVVAKLLNIVQPDVAYFGEKDYQQLAVIRRMAADLSIDVEIVGVAIVREADGLAMSSRNRHLAEVERALAPEIYRTLTQLRDEIAAGASSAAELKFAAGEALGVHGLRVEYLEFVDPETLAPIERIAAPVVIAAAVWVGATRLIDNLLCPLESRG
jgi:pantoate--beta-alanine ligase